MIYFDNSATTKVYPEVLTTYTKVSEAIWGNPSSLHKMGENAYNQRSHLRPPYSHNSY